jgi:chromosome segregation ATPase
VASLEVALGDASREAKEARSQVATLSDGLLREECAHAETKAERESLRSALIRESEGHLNARNARDHAQTRLRDVQIDLTSRTRSLDQAEQTLQNLFTQLERVKAELHQVHEMIDEVECRSSPHPNPGPALVRLAALFYRRR